MDWLDGKTPPVMVVRDVTKLGHIGGRPVKNSLDHETSVCWEHAAPHWNTARENEKWVRGIWLGACMVGAGLVRSFFQSLLRRQCFPSSRVNTVTQLRPVTFAGDPSRNFSEYVCR